MSNLRREPGAFFFYLFTSFLAVLAMSGIFRTIASASRTLSQAMVPAAVLILALVMFTGFVIPIDYMLGWSRWINYIDPMAYIFESLMINEVCILLYVLLSFRFAACLEANPRTVCWSPVPLHIVHPKQHSSWV
jgi:ABC-type multidrug transport system permease subunit